MNDRPAFGEMLRRVKFDGSAHLLGNSVAGNPACRSLDGAIRSFLDSYWDVVRGDLRLDCREGGFSAASERRVEQMLDQIHRKLLANPSRFPSLPRGGRLRTSTDEFLGVSLKRP